MARGIRLSVKNRKKLYNCGRFLTSILRVLCSWYEEMAQRGIREFDAKRILAENLPSYNKNFVFANKRVLVDKNADLEKVKKENPWLLKENLVVKVDQIIGKRGKNNLVALNVDFEGVKKFINEHLGKTAEIKGKKGKLTHFLIEPFIEHSGEYYLAITSEREEDIIHFSVKGGVDIEENWESVVGINVPVLGKLERENILKKIGKTENREQVADFIEALYKLYCDFGFCYLEINPFSFLGDQIVPLGIVAKIDDTSLFETSEKLGKIEFPVPFGREYTKEEQYINELDEKSGSSMKLTILNPEGKVWTMVAGGGASVIYADTVVDLGFEKELANYGEYSGDPSTEETYEYAKTVLDLVTRDGKKGKVLIIGGGIANFTDVAKTFKGILMALNDYADKLRKNEVKIYVRRGGPNYQEGLKQMKEAGKKLNLPIEVYGPETHMTKIVPMALKEER